MLLAIKSSSWSEYYNPELYEIGFQFFVYVLSRVFNNAQWLIVISSAIYVSAVCYFIYKNSNDIAMSLVMYVTLDLMTFQMQGMRQAIAMSLCLFAYECAKNKKLIPFILLCILAAMMHRTALIFFIVYPLVKFKYNYGFIAITLVSSIVVLLLSNRITALGNWIFGENYSSIAESGGYVAVLIYVLILSCYIASSKHLKDDKDSVILFYVVFIGFVFFLLRYTGVRMAERISFYFVFGQIALLPKILNLFKGKEKALIKATVYVLMISLFAYRLMHSNLVPYDFFWNVY